MGIYTLTPLHSVPPASLLMLRLPPGQPALRGNGPPPPQPCRGRAAPTPWQGPPGRPWQGLSVERLPQFPPVALHRPLNGSVLLCILTLPYCFLEEGESFGITNWWKGLGSRLRKAGLAHICLSFPLNIQRETLLSGKCSEYQVGRVLGPDP